MSRLGTAYLRGLQAIGRRLDYGTNAFDREWDVLVVLDACRADLLRSVAPDFEFFGEIETVRSVGSSSSEWLENTFVDRPETARTVMVTGTRGPTATSTPTRSPRSTRCGSTRGGRRRGPCRPRP